MSWLSGRPAGYITLALIVKYRAFRASPSHTVMYTAPGEARARSTGQLTASAEFLWEIEAATLEEANAIYHLRMGFEPFIPNGNPEQCPNCAAWFYPEGSGECWRCGKLC